MSLPARSLALVPFLVWLLQAAAAADPAPLRALLVTGGCCHDYKLQSETLTEGITRRARVDWTVVRGDDRRETMLDLYRDRDWSRGYDVIVHNECFGAVKDVEFVENIARPHFEGLPGVVLHCSMHSYRAAATDRWRECIGVTTRQHEKARPLEVKVSERAHPILASFPDAWTTPVDELYMIEKVWPTATPLARAHGEDTKKEHVVIWTNQCGKGRIFGTTLGHANETMGQDVYLDLVARGLLWACGKLRDDGEPAEGYGAVAGATAKERATTRILLIGHKPDHPHGSHMYLHECRLLAHCLEQTPGVAAAVSDGWPRDAVQLEGVKAIVLYSGPGGDLLLGGAHRAEVERLLAGGAGFAAIHWATADNSVERGPEYLRLLGGWFNFAFSGLKVTEAKLRQVDPAHPVSRGWKEYDLHDEYYLRIKLLPEAKPLLEVELDGVKQVVAWGLERAGGGRSFGTTLGHFHENFTREPFRRALVNGILWTAGVDVPPGGAPCAITARQAELPPPADGK
jgi:type 1 glutamine amidotransferase